MVNVSLGFRFHPTKEELMYYLFCFASEKPLPCEGVIPVKNLYGDKEPWEVCRRNCREAQYFFTPLKKAGKKGTRFARSVGKGKGTWSGKSKTEDVMNLRMQVMGHYRSLRYQNKGSDEDGLWLMTEYSLAHSLKRHAKDEYKDYVLCRIKRKGPEKNSKLSDEVHKNPVLQTGDAEASGDGDCMDLTEQMTTQEENNAVDGNSEATNHFSSSIRRTDAESAAISCNNIEQSGENMNHYDPASPSSCNNIGQSGENLNHYNPASPAPCNNIGQSGENLSHYNPASPVPLEEVSTLDQLSHGPTDHLPMSSSTTLYENYCENVFQNQFPGSTTENPFMTYMFGSQFDCSTSENPLITNVCGSMFWNPFDGASSSRTTAHHDWNFDDDVDLGICLADFDNEFNYNVN